MNPLNQGSDCTANAGHGAVLPSQPVCQPRRPQRLVGRRQLDRRTRAQRGWVLDAARRREQLRRGHGGTDCGNETRGRPAKPIISLDVSPDGQTCTARPRLHRGGGGVRAQRRWVPDPAGRRRTTASGKRHRGRQASAGRVRHQHRRWSRRWGSASRSAPMGRTFTWPASTTATPPVTARWLSSRVVPTARSPNSRVRTTASRSKVAPVIAGTRPGMASAPLLRAGLAISPGADSVYTTGRPGRRDRVRASAPNADGLARGPGSGTVSDGTGAISCSPTCSHAYPIGQVVTLTASPASGSGFVSWSGGGCSASATCQVTMTADTAVTAIFSVQTAPTPVLTGAPPSIGGTSAAFTGSVNPGGLRTTAFFQYGLDPKYTGGGPVTYTESTPAQAVGSDFASHTVTASVTGLVPNATYHVRLVASNSAGTTFGPDVVFTTLKTAPPPRRRSARRSTSRWSAASC